MSSPSPCEFEQLLDRLAARDPQAEKTLYYDLLAPIIQIAAPIHGPRGAQKLTGLRDTEDNVQSVLRLLVRDPRWYERFRGQAFSNLRNYVWCVAVNRLRHHLRAPGIEQMVPLPDDLDPTAENEPTPEDALADAEFGEYLLKRLAAFCGERLPFEQVQRLLAGEGINAVARDMGLSPTLVRGMFNALLNEVKGDLQARGHDAP